MKSKLIYEQQEKTFAVVFDEGEEAVSALLSFAKGKKLAASRFTGIGAFRRSQARVF